MLSPIRTGAVPLDQGVDSDSLPAHLARCLRSVDASTVEIIGNRVTFTAGVPRCYFDYFAFFGVRLVALPNILTNEHTDVEVAPGR